MSGDTHGGVALQPLTEDRLREDAINDDLDAGLAEPRDSLLPTQEPKGPAPSQPVVYLDGLRGVAAVMVYFQHHITEYYGGDCDLLHGFGYKGRHHLAALPFIRIFFVGGAPAVMIFFVLSGYVLSRSALRMLRDGQSPNKNLTSAVLRRPIRLFLPPAILSLPLVFALHLPIRPPEEPIEMKANIFLELGHYISELLHTFNPFIAHGPWIQWFVYNPPVWTMAYEFNGSMLVFGTLAIFGRFFAPRGRMIAFGGAALFMFYFGHWSMPCFMVGAVLAQNDVEGLDQVYLRQLSERTKTLLLNGLFIFSWYWLSQVASIQEGGKKWYGLPERLIPFMFYHNSWLLRNMIGAIILVYTILRLPWLQNIFTNFKYLGRVSFAFYLTHVPFLWIFGARLTRLFGAPVGKDGGHIVFDGKLSISDMGPQGLTLRFLVCQAIILPLNLALADFVTTWVDEPSVKASKMFAARIMARFGM